MTSPSTAHPFSKEPQGHPAHPLSGVQPMPSFVDLAAAAHHAPAEHLGLMVGMEPSTPQEPELMDELGLNDCCELSRMQRLYGFAICVSAGLFCSFLSSLMWMKPAKFAILYTMGNVLSLGSTGFLVGFMNQLKNMFKGTRLVATCVYLAAMVMTLVAACYWKSFGLTVPAKSRRAARVVWASFDATGLASSHCVARS